MSAEELVRACTDSNDGQAWEEFVSRFHQAISISVIRTIRQWSEPRRQLVDDLVQETYLKLCENKCLLLLEFTIEHPEAILGYIKTIAANVVHDYFKSLHSKKRGAGSEHTSTQDVDPKAGGQSIGSQNMMERQILLNQIDKCLETCLSRSDQERDRLIFWLHYQQGMSAKSIASLPNIGLSAKGVESAILRLTRLVRQEMVKLRLEGSHQIKNDFDLQNRIDKEMLS